MEIQEKKETIGGVEFDTQTRVQTPEDGLLPESVLRPSRIRDGKARWHKGYGWSKTYTTSDPRITRPFVYGICGLFMLIGLGLLVFDQWLMGLFFIGFTGFVFFKTKKDIDAIAEEQGMADVAPEEYRQAYREFGKAVARDFQEEVPKVIHKKSVGQMFRKFLPWYWVGAGVLTLILLLVHVFAGVLSGLVLGFIGLIYSLIAKWLSGR